MERRACVNIPSLPLQLLMRRHPEWNGHPVAVVEEDRPNGRILRVNEDAWRTRIRPGMRYAAALSLTGDLRVAVVADDEISSAVDEIAQHLDRLSPRVEPAPDEAGIFWLDASGLNSLFAELGKWGKAISDLLEGIGYRSSVVVGFTRFGTYAIARSKLSIILFDTPEHEHDEACRVRIERLGTPPAVRDALARLGVTRIAELIRLPVAGLRQRFGPEAERLHRMASGDWQVPAHAWREQEIFEWAIELDYAETHHEALTFYAKRGVDELLPLLEKSQHCVAGVFVVLRLDHAESIESSIKPAVPTNDAVILLDLLRLRFESLTLPAGVVRMELRLVPIRLVVDQNILFTAATRRDLDAGDRALARLRAEFGEESVSRAVLRSGHLPEAQYEMLPVERMSAPQPRLVSLPPLTRRFFRRPRPLPPRPRTEPDGWMVWGLEHGPVVQHSGPYLLSGAWWASEIQREYYFTETQRGDLLWIFYDRKRRRWMLHGEVL